MEYILAGFVMTIGIIGAIALGFVAGCLLTQKADEMTKEMETDDFEENVRIFMEHFPVK
jgi:uncharacterized membrane-anchored protein YhcB (DUF1043 family)